MTRRILSIVVLATFGYGCGGGGSTISGGPGEGGFERDYGPVSVRSSTAASEPVVIGSRNAVFTSVFGGTFNSINLRMPPVSELTEEEILAQTTIAYNDNGDPKLYDYGTGRVMTLGAGQYYGNSSSPSISGKGDRVAYTEIASGIISKIFVSNLDGSNRTLLTPENTHSFNPKFSPSGAKVAFYRSNKVYVVPANGGTAVAITPDGDVCYPLDWVTDSQLLIWRKPSGSSTYGVARVNVDGTQLVSEPAWTSSSNLCQLSLHPSGKMYVQSYYNGSGYTLGQYQYDLGGSSQSYADGVYGVSFAPVGVKFALAKGGASKGLYVRDFQNGAETLLVTGINITEPSWGPYIASRTVVGTGGTLGATTGGFVFGQVGDRVASFATFDATTRSTLRVTPQGDANPYQANAVCTVRGDSLTSFRYFNDLRGGTVTVVTPATAVSGAVVSFNADTGRISSVVPYRTASATRSKGTLTYTGEFTGVWNEKGENIANGGATQIVLEEGTGKILSFR